MLTILLQETERRLATHDEDRGVSQDDGSTLFGYFKSTAASLPSSSSPEKRVLRIYFRRDVVLTRADTIRLWQSTNKEDTLIVSVHDKDVWKDLMASMDFVISVVWSAFDRKDTYKVRGDAACINIFEQCP